MINPKAGAGTRQDEPATCSRVRKYESIKIVKWHGYVKGTGTKEIVSTDQNWNSLNNKLNKVVLDYNPQYKINFHEFIWYK